VGIVSSRDDEERREESGASGQLLDFDPTDPDVVKVHYDLTEWSFDQRGALSEILAERELPHDWEGDELVAPEQIETQLDAIFDELEAEFGPFAITLAPDDEATEYGLDEWPEHDRKVLTQSLVTAEIPHRWEGTTVVVARDAESTVDGLLDAIEAGPIAGVEDDSSNEPPDGILSVLFGDADELARDPLDLRSRTEVIELSAALSREHPPYAFAKPLWTKALEHLDSMVAAIEADGGDGIGVDEDDEDSLRSRAAALREHLRQYV
jgi:hypothetical protein